MIERIESVLEWHIQPRGSRQVLCRRVMTDLEARSSERSAAGSCTDSLGACKGHRPSGRRSCGVQCVTLPGAWRALSSEGIPLGFASRLLDRVDRLLRDLNVAG